MAQRLDARIAIGLGDLEFQADGIGSSTGSAAELSGRALDRLHTDGNDQRLAVDAVDDDLARDLAPIVSFVDMLVAEWRAPSAELAAWTLREPTMRQSELAERLGVTQPAISQRRKVARLDKVLELLQQFEERVARGA
ncbi:MAG: hypothetical protein GC161_12140 [Planctomycetaceae bacterium]|nr:hypothetical protein [Planctomycetaceae bacterium]